MKKTKRWIALILAIALVSTNALYQLGTHMSASESDHNEQVISTETGETQNEEAAVAGDEQDDHSVLIEEVSGTEAVDGTEEATEGTEGGKTAEEAEPVEAPESQDELAAGEEGIATFAADENGIAPLAATEGTTKIYVYVKLKVQEGVSTKGWNVNKDGWYTIGYIDVPSSSIPSASQYWKGMYADNYISSLNLNDIKYFPKNQAVAQGIDLQNVQWSQSDGGQQYGLHVCEGAADYVGAGNQWHLDGLLTISRIETHTVTIHYVYEDGTKAAGTVMYTDIKTGETISEKSPVIDGYTPDQQTVNVTVLKDDVTVTVVYHRNYPTEQITVTAGNASKEYDGKALTEDSYQYTEGILLEGDSLTATVSGSQTDAGFSDNVITNVTIRDAKGNDVTEKYNLSTQKGTLEVTPAPLSVETGSAAKVYDGEPLTNSDITVSGLKNGENLGYRTTGSRTEEGSSDNTYELLWDQGTTTAKRSNYEIKSEKLGQLTVTESKNQVVVTTVGGTFTYDGTPHGATVSVANLPKNYTAQAVCNTTVTDRTSTPVKVTADELVIYNASGKDVTKQMSILREDGEIVVNPAPLMIVTDGDTKEYDGTPLTAGGEISGLVNNETVDFAVTGTITDAGTTSNTYTLDFNKTAKKENYEIVSKKLGTLEVTRAPLKVVTEGAVKVYDGTALTNENLSVTGLKNKETLSAKTTGSQTEVGSSENGYELIWNGSAKEANYEVKDSEKGMLTVTESEKEIVVTTTGEEVTYDGEPHGAAVTVSNLPEGYSVKTAESTATATDVTQGVTATADQLVIVNASGKDVTDKLQIKKVDGKIVIHPATLTIITPTEKKTYTGTPLTAEGTITGFVNETERQEVTFTTTGTITNAGSTENSYSITWPQNGTAKATNYTIVQTVGTLTVDPAPLKIKTEGREKVYDGTPLTCSEMKIDGFVNGESVSYRTTGSQTDVGNSKNTYELEWNQSAVSSNYQIVSIELGTLNVKENEDEITVTTTGGEFTYDGQPHGANVTVSTLPAGYDLKTAKSTATATNVADGTVTATADELVIVNAKGEDVTSKLKIKKIDGTIKINPAALTVTTPSADRTYNGKPLTAPGTIDGFVNNESAEFTTTGTITDAGTVTNGYKITWPEGVEANNYSISEDLGKLTVNKKLLTITTESKTKTYDGTALTADGMIEGLVNGETVDFKVTGSQTKVGSSENTYKLDWTNAKSQNYEISESVGTLTVKESEDEIIVTTTGGEFTYDGLSHGATVSVSNLPSGYTLRTAVSTATVKDVADGTVTATADQLVIVNADQKDVTSELNIRKIDGTLKIKPAVLNVVTSSAGRKYTGTPLTAGGTITGFVTGENATLTTIGTITDVGEKSNGYTITWPENVKKDNYEIKESIGKLSVTPAELTIVTDSAEKVYDGTPLTAGGALTGLVNGETAKLVTTGSQTKVGSTSNDYSIDWITAKSGNYTIADTTIGTLTVKESEDEIVVTTTGGTYTYDGMPHGATVTVGTLPEGYRVETAVSDAAATDVADGTVTATADHLVIVNADGEDVTSKLKITKKDGTITIIPATLNVTTESADKEYDGTALTAGGTITGFVNGETAVLKTTGTITDKGTADNTYTISWPENVKPENYTVKEALGVLTVSPRALTITTRGAQKVYDGEPLTNDSIEVTGLVTGENLVYKTTGSQTEVGDSDNTYKIDWKNSKTTAKEDNYCITSEQLGKLVIKESEDEIVVTTTGGIYTYDGQPHKAVVEVMGLPKGYTVKTAVSDTEVTDAIKDAVIVTADQLVITNASGKDVTKNLKIRKVDGTILINPATLIVTTPDADKTYDGTPLTAEGTITGFVNGEQAVFTTTGTITEVGTTTNSYTIDWPETVNADNYVVEEHLGTLEIREAETPENPENPNTPGSTDNPGTSDTPGSTDNQETPGNQGTTDGQETSVDQTTAQAAPGVISQVAEAIKNVPQAIEDTVKNFVARVEEVVNPDEDAVPLGNQKLNDHKCCIFHFLIMLITVILYGFFTHNMKKRQKKNFELREELDLELAKRGLPTSKEQKQNE